ncbi:GDSL esterase/lipase CPRD49-like isoform X2 [Pistacia vera]|uniref:GDSL esterase/lipase CPRD49-like isoform X2 n=1 Tax=Pistacia vera TaxID=55513 RepID=UPI001262E182|nr:GDSL esterase/lipase CPRD49-like isoform X2 [Pistacia vera]
MKGGVQFWPTYMLVRHTFARILWLEFKAWPTSTRTNFSQASVQPALVIVYFGGNDSMHPHPSGIGPHVPLPEYIENMRKIALHLKSLSPTTRIIFLSTPPINEQQIKETLSGKFGKVNRTNEDCRVYSEACLQLCQEMDVNCIDLWTAVQQRDDWLTTCFTDGIHFSPEGSKIVVKEILKVLREAEWEPSLHWKSLSTEFSEDSLYDPIGPDAKTTINVSDMDVERHMQWE